MVEITINFNDKEIKKIELIAKLRNDQDVAEYCKEEVLKSTEAYLKDCLLVVRS